MAWFTDRNVFLLAIVVYGLSTLYTVFLWRKGFRQDDRASFLMLFLAFALHTTSMVQRGLVQNRCPVSNLYEITTFVGWTIVLLSLAVGFLPRQRFLCAFASPVVLAIGVFALMPGLNPDRLAPNTPGAAWTSLHAAAMALSYGAFGLACVVGLMFLTQEHNLKFNKLRAITSLLPPIQRLETVLGRLLVCGFILLTVGLGLGACDLVLSGRPRPHSIDPKILWSVVVWLIYLGLLVMRWKFAQGGRRFALGAVGSFVFVLLTFWGSNLLSPIHNP